MRSDLAEALRSNGALHARIKSAEAELVKLRAKTKADTKTIEDLTKERVILSQKVRDRDEELRGKARFIEVREDDFISSACAPWLCRGAPADREVCRACKTK